jgi:hypothetical protein
MSDVKKKYRNHYTLEAAAAQLGISIDDILQASEDGLVSLCYRAKSARFIKIATRVIDEPDDEGYIAEHYIDEYGSSIPIGTYIDLTKESVIQLIVNRGFYEGSNTFTPADTDEIVIDNGEKGDLIAIDDVLIRNEDVSSLKTQNEQPKQPIENEENPVSYPELDEFKQIIEAFKDAEVYKRYDIGVQQQKIQDWLDETYTDLTIHQKRVLKEFITEHYHITTARSSK